MKIIFAKNIGFCSGVKRAVVIAEEAIKKSPKPIQFLGNLVHNEKVIEKFKKKGVKFVKKPKEVTRGTLIIQAHGFPPFKISPKIFVKDATCLLVKKAQNLAYFLHKKGYQVIIVGEKNHSEVMGINGRVENKAIIIENEKEVKKVPRFPKIGVVAQTTQRKENFNKILKKLKNRVKEIKYFDTICPEVVARQKELNKIFKKCDGILVIGSRLSANTRRLAERAKNSKKKLFWVNCLKELKKKNLKKISYLGIVSGTSTPDWEINKIIKWLKK